MELDPNVFASAFVGGGAVAALLALGIFLVFIIIGLYVYFAFAWMKIAKKLKYKRPWLAWIPIANTAMWLQFGGFHWAWIFLILIPYAGWIAIGVLTIISHWRVFKKFKYPEWLSLVLVLNYIPIIGFVGIIAYGIIIGLVAWKK